MKTHNTKFCRFKKEENDSNNTAASQENKEESNYSLYHDSGTSKTMLNFKPPKILQDNISIPIRTAGANQKPQFATSRGVFKLGSEEIETLEVPTFSKSLLSATHLSIEHGFQQVIEPWTAKLTISKDDTAIATGTYENLSNSLKLMKNRA